MSSTSSNNKAFVGILLIFSPIVTFAIGAALGFFPYYTLLGFLSIAWSAGYFISAYIKLKISLEKTNTLFLTIFISFGLLNIAHFIIAMPYGLEYQGKLITYGFSTISIASHIYFFFVIKKIFATQPLENHWKAHGLFWFWLSALAFPWLGEMF